MPYLNGAQATIATLRAYHVDTIFGIPGAHTLPLYDALSQEPGLHHILARHEQGAGFMADGYARATGHVGVVCTITGPGVTNVATPVANAYADSVPLLLISSSLPRASQRRALGELHEVKDQLGTMASLSGWSRCVTGVEEIPDALHEAFRVLQSGRPRAAYLQIPYDLFESHADVQILPMRTSGPIPPSQASLAAAERLLRHAQRPLIIAGNGVTAAGAHQQLARLAQRLQAPVLLGSKSHDVLPSDHPLTLTSTGYDLIPELLSLVSASDVVLVVGSKLGAERTGAGRLPLSSTLIHIDIEPDEIGRAYPATVAMVADASLALERLLEGVHDLPQDRPTRAAEVAAVRAALRQYTRHALGDAVLLLDAIREAVPHEGVIVADMTMLGYASARYLPVYQPRTFIHPVEFCAIGCALPMALGARIGRPDRPVIALCGDGGFLLNVAELATAVQEQIHIVIIVFNDQAYTAVKKVQHQRFSARYIATDLAGPDYVALAHAFGIKGMRVDDPDHLHTAVSEAVQHQGTTLIEVPLPPWHWYQQASLP
ncbi:MAG TPA: thiamine pyrophosphate-binding protein [Ktedonobacteraceae bacterium]|nr:thiamine pyrophosphate-binding protein [Ktedonobacteraceae bacterium]